MIEIIKPGLLTTIQDLGRFGYRQYGVPVSGVMDQNSAKVANQILGNTENMPLLEITLMGPTLQFNQACQITIAGAEFEPTLNGVIVQNNVIIPIKKGSILAFGHVKKGMRAYLAILGGFKAELMMKSASFYPNITHQSQFKKGDQLLMRGDIPDFTNPKTVEKPNSTPLNASKLMVFKGPEFDLLSAEGKSALRNQTFKVSSKSNRMGCRLIGDGNRSAKEIITAPVQPGTVQLTPSGQLIILGRDAQTTGGYARVLQLTEKAQDCLAQVQFGAALTFKILP